jgi:hypothetical protein
MTGFTNMPAGTEADGGTEPDGGADPTGPDEEVASAEEIVLGDPGGFVTPAPEHACARTTVTSAIDRRGDPTPRIVNP